MVEKIEIFSTCVFHVPAYVWLLGHDRGVAYQSYSHTIGMELSMVLYMHPMVKKIEIFLIFILQVPAYARLLGHYRGCVYQLLSHTIGMGWLVKILINFLTLWIVWTCSMVGWAISTGVTWMVTGAVGIHVMVQGTLKIIFAKIIFIVYRNFMYHQAISYGNRTGGFPPWLPTVLGIHIVVHGTLKIILPNYFLLFTVILCIIKPYHMAIVRAVSIMAGPCTGLLPK